MDDLISRKQAVDALDGEITITGRANATAVKGYVNLVKDRLERLPSVQPKRGKWTADNACSECGYQPWFSGDIHNYNFCPNCGADMRGEHDG